MQEPFARENLTCRTEPSGGKLIASQLGAFVYRLGREVLNLERGVQLPYALPEITKSKN